MRIRLRGLSALWKFAVCMVAVVGLLYESGLMGTGAVDTTSMAYYTMVVIVACAVYFLLDCCWVLINKHGVAQGRELALGLKHALLVSVLVSCLICNTGLASLFAGFKPRIQAQLWLSVLLPVAVTLDYLLFEHKGNMRPAGPFAWLLAPAAYAGVFAVLQGLPHLAPQLASYLPEASAPYAFLRFTPDALASTLQSMALLALVFLGVGYVMYAIDHVLGKHANISRPAKSRAGSASRSKQSGKGDTLEIPRSRIIRF